MLHGRYGDTSGRPYLEGRLFLPRLGIQGDISFLVDTGADRTLLMVDDAQLLGIDYSKLKLSKQSSVGIGGVARHFVERGIVVFAEPGRYLYAYEIQIAIAQPEKSLKRVPSLLGRDIISRWQMIYAPRRSNLRFTVLSSDLKVRIS